MFRFYSRIVGIFLAFLISFGVSSGFAESLRVGVEGAYPPFSYKNSDGSVGGFDIDIANALCDEMGVECELVEQEWDGMIPGLLARKFDMIIASMSVTDERKKRVDFSDKYYNTPNSIVVRKGVGLNNLSDLSGKRIGVQRGTTHQCYVEKFLKESALKLYGTQEEVFLDLAAGRLDAQMSDAIQAKESFLSTPAGANFEAMDGDYIDLKCHGIGAGVAVRKGEDALVRRINSAISAIRANGVYQRINSKYFDFDIYGG